MALGNPKRIQKDVEDLIKTLPCAKMGMQINDVVKILALFCKENKREFKKWENEKYLKQKK